MLLLSSADFFHNFFQKIPEHFKSVKRFGSISILIWVQTVYKGFQQRTKVATGMVRVKKR